MDLAEETSGAAVTGEHELPLNSGGSPLDKNGSLENKSGDFGCGEDGEDGISRSQVVQEGASRPVADREAKDINSDRISAEKDGLSMKTKDGLTSSSVEGRIGNDGMDGKASLLPDDGDSIAASVTSPVDKQASAATPSPDRLEIMTKGKGLRKWRRRRREMVVKDGIAEQDLHRALKRGISNIDLVNAPAQPGAMDSKFRSEEGVGTSMDSTVGLGFSPTLNFGTPLPISKSGSFSDVRNVFVASAGSEKSQDQSTKSSTAANFPTTKHDPLVGKVRENDQIKGTILVLDAETQLEEKNLDDGSKKFRAERVSDEEFGDESLGNHLEGEGSSKIDEQTNDQADSYCSVESDSRSCSIVGSSATDALISTNGCFADHRNGRWTQEGKQSWSSYCDGEVNQFECRDSKAGDEDEKHKYEEAHSAYCHENGVELQRGLIKEESGDTSGPKFQTVAENDRFFEQEGAKKGERVRPVKPLNQNRKSPFGGDPWTESLAQLQVVQEALKKEILKVGVMRKEAFSRPDISSHILGSTDKHEKIVPTSSDADSRCQIDGNGFPSIELLPGMMYHRVMVLESRLKDAEKMIRHKEVRVKELEAVIAEANLVKDGSDGNLQYLGKMLNNREMEIERLFMDKVEAEIRYYVVNESNKEVRPLIEDQLPFVEAHKLLLEEQSQMLNKLKDAEERALLLKSRAEELENACANLSAVEKKLEVRSNVSKISLYCFIQLMLLLLALKFLFFQSSPYSPGVVPT